MGSEKRSPQKVSYCLAYKNEGLDLEEQKERERSTDSLPATLSLVVCGLAKGTGIKAEIWGTDGCTGDVVVETKAGSLLQS